MVEFDLFIIFDVEECVRNDEYFENLRIVIR